MATITLQAPYRPEQSSACQRLVGAITGNPYISDGLGRVTIDILDQPDAMAKGFLLASGGQPGPQGPQGPPGSGITSITAGSGLTGGVITTSGTIAMPSVGAVGSYNNANITVDAQGRVTAASTGSSGGGTQVVITAAIATIGSPYIVGSTVGRVLLNKTVGAASYIQLPVASSMGSALAFGVLIKDIKGDADVNNITVQFTGGELCDGAATLTIGTKYGFVTVNPVPGASAWYAS